MTPNELISHFECSFKSYSFNATLQQEIICEFQFINYFLNQCAPLYDRRRQTNDILHPRLFVIAEVIDQLLNFGLILLRRDKIPV